jgi:hypothetical protein
MKQKYRWLVTCKVRSYSNPDIEPLERELHPIVIASTESEAWALARRTVDGLGFYITEIVSCVIMEGNDGRRSL